MFAACTTHLNADAVRVSSKNVLFHYNSCCFVLSNDAKVLVLSVSALEILLYHTDIQVITSKYKSCASFVQVCTRKKKGTGVTPIPLSFTSFVVKQLSYLLVPIRFSRSIYAAVMQHLP